MINTEWDEKFESGHERIDQEHLIFLNLIRNASKAAESQYSSTTRSLLIEIRKYADFHFSSEEGLMIEANYPDYERHRDAHTKLLSSLDNKIGEFDNETVQLDEVAAFLFEWFSLHTTTADKRMAAYLLKNQHT